MSSSISRLVCLIVVGCIVSMSSAAVLTVGKSGATYTTLIDALDAANPNDTVQFIDSETYLIADVNQNYDQGLIIESAPGEKATLNFSGGGWTGLYLGATDMTVRNLNIESDRSVAIWAGMDNPTIDNVNITVTADDSKGIVGETGLNVTSSTFIGTSVYGGNAIQVIGEGTIDHCSFYQWTSPIMGDSSAVNADITNSVFGVWYNTTGYAAISIKYGSGDEDYNAYGGVSSDYVLSGSNVTIGVNTINLGAATSPFAGDPSTGDWSVIESLYTAASDGTTIGAWQAPTQTLLEGDANRDGVVSAGDYASVQANFGSTGEAGIPGDANLDGVVSAGDYASVQANFGNVAPTAVPVPEPATMALLSLGAAAMIRRRR